LVGEGLHEVDLLVGEKPLLHTGERDDPEDRSVADEGNVEECLGPARSCELRRAARGTPVVLGEVGHLDRPLFEMGSADEGVRADRHPAAFYRSRDDLGVQLRRDGEHVRIAHRPPDDDVARVAEARGVFGHGLEDRLEAER